MKTLKLINLAWDSQVSKSQLGSEHCFPDPKVHVCSARFTSWWLLCGTWLLPRIGILQEDGAGPKSFSKSGELQEDSGKFDLYL